MRSALHAPLLAPLLALLPAVAVVAAPVDDEPTTYELLRTLRDPDLALDEKAPAVDSLLDRGVEAQRALGEELERQIEKLTKAFDESGEGLERDFQRVAPRVIQRRIDRAAEGRLDELRAEVLQYSRSGSLTKEQVQQEVDPRVREIEGLLTTTSQDVFDVERELEVPLLEVLDAYTAHDTVRGWHARARTALAADEDGQKYLERLTEIPDLSEAYLAMMLRLSDHAALATPMTESDRAAFAHNDSVAGELDPGEVEGIRKLNLRRVHLGLNALRIDVKLCAAGRDHSKDMVELGFFSHTSPVEGKETPAKRAANFGTSGGAENIAAGQPDGLGSFRAWWYSPGHHRNMMAGHHRIGLGRHQQHWTQMFG